jgi:hypothetical protein
VVDSAHTSSQAVVITGTPANKIATDALMIRSRQGLMRSV